MDKKILIGLGAVVLIVLVLVAAGSFGGIGGVRVSSDTDAVTTAEDAGDIATDISGDIAAIDEDLLG